MTQEQIEAPRLDVSRHGERRPNHDDLPVWVSTGVLLLVAFIANVWGDFPVNDDWQYAHLAKHFVETGELHIGGFASPSLVGQLVLGAALVRVTGFSHAYLRTLTMAVAILMCWMLNRILLIADVSRTVRIFCLLLVILNPVSGHLIFSFMSEYYGYALALGGVLVWFTGRVRADASGACLISTRNAVLAAALIGGSYWIRQYCVLAFPAVLVATAFSLGRDQWRRASASAGPLIWATLTFLGAIGTYFWWSRASGNFAAYPGGSVAGPMARMMSFDPWANLTKLDPAVWLVMSLCASSYATLFMLPMLAALPWRRALRHPLLMAGLGYLGVMTAALCAFLGRPDSDVDARLHRTFPYLRNLVYNAGVGPLSPDMWPGKISKYGHWDVRVWIAIEILLVLGHLLWAALPSFAELDARRRELVSFGVAFSVFSLMVMIQASQASVFDRYLFAILLGGAISMACFMGRARLVWWRGAIVLGSLALFTVGGLHDYFAFNQARWQLAAAAQSHGVSTADMSGGFEVNGWFRWELPQDKPRLPVIRQCMDANCLNDAFVIGTVVPEGYVAADSRRVQYWLTNGPDLLLSRRSDIPSGWPTGQ